MTVVVTLTNGGTTEYARFGDAYFKNDNGSLDIVRQGVREPHRYEAGSWSDVDGDERKHKKRRFWF